MSLTISLSLLGNPDGRVVEVFPSTTNAHAATLQMLQRYGDIIPRKGSAEVRDASATVEIIYEQLPSGQWNFPEPTDSQQQALSEM